MSLPEDKKNRLGYGWFSWPWPTPFDDCMEVHDRNDTKGSFATKIGINGERIDRNWSEMVKETIKSKKLPWYWKAFGYGTIGIVWAAGRHFTENRYFPKGESIDKDTKIERDES